MSTTTGECRTDPSETTVILGAEHDGALQRRVIRTLRDLGAALSPSSWTLAGSQEIVSREATLDGRTIRIDCETYVGFSLTGDADLVARVTEALQRSKDD